jgi:predicted RNA-binding Zn ribbon-like protein
MEHPDDHRGLDSYGDLVDWSKAAGQIDEQTARQLLGHAGKDEDGGRRALSRAIELREVIYRLIVAAISGARADQVDVLAFDSALRDARARLRLVQDGEAFGWRWADLADSLDGPLGPVLESAAQLLTSPADLARVRRCGGESCDWLFIDNTKNRSRRWCSMSGCGNRAKAKRHYQRQRAER